MRLRVSVCMSVNADMCRCASQGEEGGEGE